MKKLYVGNMSFDTREGELRSIFEPYGEITSINVITDRETGQPRGFAFVELADDGEAAKAITELNGKELGGRALKVNEANPKPERSGPRAEEAVVVAATDHANRAGSNHRPLLRPPESSVLAGLRQLINSLGFQEMNKMAGG